MTPCHPCTPSNPSRAVTLSHLPLAEPGSGPHRTAGGSQRQSPRPPPPRRLTTPPSPVAFVNPCVYGNLCARRWDERRGHSPGRAGARGTLQGPCPKGMHRIGGSGMLPGSQAPCRQAACPAVGHPLGLSMGIAWGGTKAGACRGCLWLPRAVCTHGCHVEGWHCRCHMRWAPAVAQSLQGAMGGHGQGQCQALGPTREMGASTLPAWAVGSHGTRYKHLEHMCMCVCPSQTQHGHAHSTRGHAHMHSTLGLCRQQAGIPPSPCTPLPHSTLQPHWGAVGAHLGVQALPAKLGTAVSSASTAWHCCLPCGGAGCWGALKPG